MTQFTVVGTSEGEILTADADGVPQGSNATIDAGDGAGGLFGLPVYTTQPTNANVPNGSQWLYYDGSKMSWMCKHANLWFGTEMGSYTPIP
jgi:hypothetical protein